jgi:hypothetical protein
MLPVTQCFSTHPPSWTEEHQDHLRPFNFVEEKRYSQLFQYFVCENVSFENNLIIHGCCQNILQSSQKTVFKQLKSPSFGILMALFECHLMYSEPIIPLSENNNFFLAKALYYSMVDIIREKLRKAVEKKPSIASSEDYQNFMNFIAAFPFQKTLQIHSDKQLCGEILLKKIRETLYFSNESAIVLDVCQKSSHAYSLAIRSSKNTERHCFFLFLSSKREFFYFYDNRLNSIVTSDSLEELLTLFTDFLRKERPFFLQGGYSWNFSSSPPASE